MEDLWKHLNKFTGEVIGAPGGNANYGNFVFTSNFVNKFTDGFNSYSGTHEYNLPGYNKNDVKVMYEKKTRMINVYVNNSLYTQIKTYFELENPTRDVLLSMKDGLLKIKILHEEKVVDKEPEFIDIPFLSEKEEQKLNNPQFLTEYELNKK